jgi:hypothetical protein
LQTCGQVTLEIGFEKYSHIFPEDHRCIVDEKIISSEGEFNVDKEKSGECHE